MQQLPQEMAQGYPVVFADTFKDGSLKFQELFVNGSLLFLPRRCEIHTDEAVIFRVAAASYQLRFLHPLQHVGDRIFVSLLIISLLSIIARL